jgi:tetrapyrrole methylase family protein/MazG family protein
MTKNNSFSKLVWLMAKLRSKTGCPWDRVQTHKSLKPYLVEETCEVLDAINKKRPEMLLDELGDLLYQVLFHSQIAKENGQFDINDVTNNAYKKLWHRHPHVFGKTKIKGADNVINHWHKSKLKEARKKSKKHSVVSNIPHVLPALQKAGKVQRKAAIVGFDWKHVHDIINKVDEELIEVKDAIKKGKTSHIREEIGDLLFAIVNLSRFFGIESEHALHETIHKFIVRFRKLEKFLARKGKNIEECSLTEMEKAWNIIKKK